jgi:hypothetical protein
LCFHSIVDVLRIWWWGNAVTPLKLLPNEGTGHDILDAESSERESDDDECEDEDPVPPKKRKRVVAEYVLVKRWITGERAVQPEEDIELKPLEEARKLMHLSGPKKTSWAIDIVEQQYCLRSLNFVAYTSSMFSMYQ